MKIFIYSPFKSLRQLLLSNDYDENEGYDFIESTSVVANCTICPAGSYCATTRLATATGLCAIGSYSVSGATACSTCPSTGMTDKDGNTVVATTASTVSTTVAACNIGSDVYFTDDIGTYHFTSNCAFGVDFYESDDGTCLGGYIYGESMHDTDEEGNPLTGCFQLPSTKEECVNSSYGSSPVWENGQCVCPNGFFTIVSIGNIKC